MRIQKDLENKYRFELDAKTVELDKVSETYFEAKRVSEILKAQVEGLKLEHEKSLQEHKKRYQDEIQELIADNH